MAAATNPIDLEVWDATTERDIGLFIGRYLRGNPAPDGPALAKEIAACGEGLEKGGERRLDRLARRAELGDA
jgi:hypothetical protein